MTYAEAMRRYGSDKPDLRIPLELVDVADLVKDCEFKVFAGPAADPDGRVAALRVPQGGEKLSRKEIDDYTAFVARYGAKGLAYVKVNEATKGREGLQSPILKFLSDAAVAGLMQRTGAQTATWCSSAPTRPRSSTTRSARCGSRSARTSGWSTPAGRRCGSSTSRCSSGTPTRSAGRRCTIRSPRRSTTIRRR